MNTTTSIAKANLSDEELVQMYKRDQNTLYFEELYKRHSNKVFGKCLSILKDTDAANDAVQEIFIKILLNLAKFKEASKFSTWIYSITYNFCMDTVRRQKKNMLMFSGDDDKIKELPDEVEDHEILETSIGRLKIVLNKIPIGDKAILMMKYQDSMSIKEISAVLLKTESAVKMKIKRAKHKFRLVYNDNYID